MIEIETLSGDVMLIPISSIVFFKAMGEHTKIKTNDGLEYIAKMSFNTLKYMLGGGQVPPGLVK